MFSAEAGQLQSQLAKALDQISYLEKLLTQNKIEFKPFSFTKESEN